jgi:hypothetical protein
MSGFGSALRQKDSTVSRRGAGRSRMASARGSKDASDMGKRGWSVAPGKVRSGPGMRVDLQPSSIEKSSRMQACRGPPVLSGTAGWSPIPREGERCLQ